MTLSFETGDAVDDIRCGLADGTTLWLQAKRACGVDAQLRAAAVQWVGQLGSLREADKVGLATAETEGTSQEPRRRPRPAQACPRSCGTVPAGETTALDALRDQFPAGTSAQVADWVMNAAIVMTVDASSSRDEGFRSVAYLVDGTVVPASSGTAAVAALQRAFQEHAAAGTGSGLDECGNCRAVVADGLAAVAGGLPGGTGIVLATRDSGLAAAGKLNMPEARLTEPPRLGAVLGRLLDHIAACRVPEPDRDQWVRQRQQQLEEIRGGHPDLWRIPLFATLLTLLVARPAPRRLPASRARLLAEAVQDTVERWELARLPQTSPDPGMRAEQLLDGYSEIAHILIGEPGGCPAETVSRRVEAMLAERWGLAAGEARAHVREIMGFWDEHVGVFVASPVTGDIEPRSRVFAEAGEAMWAARQDPASRRDWISAALADDDRREQVVLAAGLSADVASELIETACHAVDPTARSHGLLWAADATADGAQPTTESLTALITALAQAATSPPTSGMQPQGDVTELDDSVPRPEWPYAQRIAILPLPDPLRPQPAGRT